MTFDINKFPENRDIYTLREIASILYDIPMNQIERWDMTEALKDMKEAGRYYRMFGGGQKTWPGGGGSHTFYCIRNIEDYRLVSNTRNWDRWNGDDWDAVCEHLLNFKPPGQTALSRKQRATRNRTIEMHRRR